jgi:MFS family permease
MVRRVFCASSSTESSPGAVRSTRSATLILAFLATLIAFSLLVTLPSSAAVSKARTGDGTIEPTQASLDNKWLSQGFLTLATIFGALIGFVLVAVSIVLAAGSRPRPYFAVNKRFFQWFTATAVLVIAISAILLLLSIGGFSLANRNHGNLRPFYSVALVIMLAGLLTDWVLYSRMAIELPKRTAVFYWLCAFSTVFALGFFPFALTFTQTHGLSIPDQLELTFALLLILLFFLLLLIALFIPFAYATLMMLDSVEVRGTPQSELSSPSRAALGVVSLSIALMAGFLYVSRHDLLYLCLSIAALLTGISFLLLLDNKVRKRLFGNPRIRIRRELLRRIAELAMEERLIEGLIKKIDGEVQFLRHLTDIAYARVGLEDRTRRLTELELRVDSLRSSKRECQALLELID